MKLKLDENLSRHLKPILSGLGHDVLTAADENLLLHPDIEVASACLKEGRMLPTLDVEFADLCKYPPGAHPGIILFRALSFGPLTVNKFIADFVRSVDLRQFTACMAIVDPDRVRVRAPEKQTRCSTDECKRYHRQGSYPIRPTSERHKAWQSAADVLSEQALARTSQKTSLRLTSACFSYASPAHRMFRSADQARPNNS